METEHLNTTACEPNTACNGQGMPYFCNSVPVLTTLSLLDLETLDFTSVIEDFVRYSCLLQTNIYHICLLKVSSREAVWGSFNPLSGALPSDQSVNLSTSL